MRKMKRLLSAMLAAAMLLSMIAVPGSALEAREETITVSMEFLDKNDASITAGVSEGELFYFQIDFTGNPTEISGEYYDGICGFKTFLQYDTDALSIEDGAGGDISSPDNLILVKDNALGNSGVASVEWISTGGIYTTSGKKRVYLESGILYYLEVKAKKALSQEELESAIAVIDGIMAPNASGTADVPYYTEFMDADSAPFKVSGVKYVINPAPEPTVLSVKLKETMRSKLFAPKISFQIGGGRLKETAASHCVCQVQSAELGQKKYRV